MRFFVSTSIPYINANPHIGFLWELLLADFYARFQRNLGNEVFFLSGSDENGLKIYRAAEERGLSIEKFADEMSSKFYDLKDKFNISFDYFIRTSSKEHKQGVYKFWQLAKKDIYVDYYEGLYCVGCEDYYKPEEVENNICPVHNKPLEKFQERNYFFKLKKYLPKVQELIENNIIKIVPEKRKYETLNILKSRELQDLSISRSASRSKGWGIPVPDDDSQVVYVWFDALVNYVTGLGFAMQIDTDNKGLFEKFWGYRDDENYQISQNSKIVHFIGKDIFKFHAIYWPAMLLSVDLRLPDTIVIHDHFTIEGMKMSKSLGNFIEPDELLQNYSAEAIRYYFLSQFNQFEDTNFSKDHLREVYEGELKNEIGNFVSRVFGLLKKTESELLLDENFLQGQIENTRKQYHFHINKFEFNEALKAVFELVKTGNRFIEDNKIWQSENVAHFKTLVLCLLEVAKGLEPAMPIVSSKILDNLEVKNHRFINKKINFQPLFNEVSHSSSQGSKYKS